ncbi:spore protease YyaC [Virgibacillus byunsanensis]|uniref:Spore protease YyaC n=1 Tax=Virgibacillus byunsanensis TaxID=570945 RepID=A0ABW3LQE5_9BACI
MNLMNRFTSKNENFRMLHTDLDLIENMSNKLISWLPEFPREYIVVCIGTDRSTGDALGPLTGSYLEEKNPKHITVYGTLTDPVHAKNLEQYISLINSQHRNPYIIAIDACLGKTTSVGHLIAGVGPLEPGSAFNKPLPPIGDIHITGVVNVSGFMEFSVLQNTRLSIVVEMAKKTAAILEVIDKRMNFTHSLPAVIRPQSIKQTSVE